MSWSKREAVSNLVILGDDEGSIKKAGGLLASVSQDQVYPQRQNYELIQKNGDSIVLAGSASLSRQILPADVGKFLKAEFIGWGRAANGKFKEIAVHIWEGEPTHEMRQWPRFDELRKKTSNTAKESFAEKPAAVDDDDDDDDLPF